MKHARIQCRSILIIDDISLSMSVSRIESKNCEKKLISRLTIAYRDVSGYIKCSICFKYRNIAKIDFKKTSFVKN